ncbi:MULTISPECIES: hypothetical protein [Streptomyces]|uniref:hypothetical protein n=1 Tax=Streptomyces TaxID=1883 RepID=UPI001BDDC8EE|nr:MULTISPECIES: hypothetical protein [Streptomyces]MBT1101783.1 hypothetical protein [Streptomyces sp. Tu10]MDF9807090.1 hypothetical protein [Streptomyces sp. HB372]WUC86244.1 hypothetical protein OHQ35_09180 [Streptomyces anulatus]WUD88399.1 hypothetical protein OG703_09670 [Streptomyces anulatus]
MQNGEDGIVTDPGGGGGTGDLRRGVGALETFKKRVDALLTDFEGSAASKTKVADQKVSRASLSGPNARFAEADGLYTQYNRVHSSLVSLSKSLGDQIEYLSLGVHAAAVGFDNVEDDIRRRFYEIQARMDAEREKHAKSEPSSNDKQSDSGWAAE